MSEMANQNSELEDILLFHLYKSDSRYNFEDITNLFTNYGCDVTIEELRRVCEKLGDERKLIWKASNGSIQVKLLVGGHNYVASHLQPQTVNAKRVGFERIREVLDELGISEDFEILEIESKEGLSINYAPRGRFSENYFRIIRMKFLFYATFSDPKVNVEEKRNFESVIKAFQQWLNFIKENPKSPVVTTTTTTTEKRLPRTPIAFAVGAYWSGDDQTERFLNEGLWENGKDEGDEPIMDDIRTGDTFVLKSVFQKDGISFLRIKGLGKVLAKKSEGIFEVDWTIKDVRLDLENLGFYRRAIEQIKRDDWLLIESRLQQHFEKNSNVILQYDSISEEDLLGRKPFAKAMADYVSRLWKEQKEDAYTIHLSGEWGSGKSNFLKFLAKDLEDRDWYVLHYNAWEYQHIENPWWMFVNKIYKQILSRLGCINKLLFWLKEFWWRLIVINKLSWISFLFIGISAVLFWRMTFSDLESNAKTDWLSLIGTILTTGGSLWLLFKGISGSLLPASDESAQNFQKNINDPVHLVKAHFESMVKYPNRNIAIFIDDIDRCSSKSVVRLLEGIQTIFKSTKVLYVFAGDAGWIRRCFEIEYDGFVGNFNKPGHTLGNFFVEKVFQMSISIPVITSDTVKSFLNKTLNPISSLYKTQSPDEMIKKDFENVKNEIDIEIALNNHRGTENEERAIAIAIEQLSGKEALRGLEHELETYYTLLPHNVRSIKRFINNYAIARQALLLQRVSFTDVSMDVLVRWLIVSAKYPLLAEELSKRPELINQSEGTVYQEIFSSSEFKALANNYLTEEKIRLIVGK